MERCRGASKKGGKAKPLSAKVSIYFRLNLQRARAIGIDFAALFLKSRRATVAEATRVEASLWTRCMGALEAELPEQQFNTWVRPLQAMEGTGALKLLAPNRFVVDWVNANLLPRIGELLRDESTGDVPIVTVEVGSRSAPLRSAVAPAAAARARAPRRGAGGRRAAESRLHLRHASSRARATSSPRPPRCRSRRIPAAPTTRCSSTAASDWARRT